MLSFSSLIFGRRIMRTTLIVFLIFFSTQVLGQNSESNADSEDYLPVLDSKIPAIEKSYKYRQIRLWRAAISAGDGAKAKLLPYYFVEPLFQFEVSGKNKYPWEVIGTEGNLQLKFKVVLHTSEQKKVAKEHVMKFLKKDGATENDINSLAIWFWTTKKIKLFFYDEKVKSETNFLVIENDRVGTSDRSSTVTVISSAVEMDLIKRLEKLYDENELFVEVHYNFRGVDESSASLAASFSSEQKSSLTKSLELAVKNTKVADKQYIFADTERDIVQLINRQTRAAIGGSNPEMIKLLPDLGKSFIDKLERKSVGLDFESKNDPLVKAYSKYMEPLKRTKQITSEDERTEEFKITAAKLPKAEFEKKHRMLLKKDDKTELYTPTEITYAEVSNFDSMIKDVLFVDIATTLSNLKGYVKLDNFKVKEAATNFSPSLRDKPVLYDVPIGTVLCSMSSAKKPPNGFYWINNSTEWPNQSWIPEGVNPGDAMPNSEHSVLVGVSKKEELGKAFSGSTIRKTEESYVHYDMEHPHPAAVNAPPGGKRMQMYGVTLKEVIINNNTDSVAFSHQADAEDTRIDSLVRKGAPEDRDLLLPKEQGKKFAPYRFGRILDKYYVPIRNSPFRKAQYYPPTIGCRYMIRMDVN